MNYKGHVIERQGDRFVVLPYNQDFPSLDEAQRWVDGHVDRESKKSARPGSVLDIVKGTAAHRVSFEARLAKADNPKPPSGYSPIPGGMHGGFRKKSAKGWTYWYPDSASATSAMRHHDEQSRSASKRMRQADDEVTRSPRASSAQTTAAYRREEARKEATEHKDIASGAAKFLAKQSVTSRMKEEFARQKQAREAAAALPEVAPEGQHYISHVDGYRMPVTTVAAHGLYAVHGDKDTGYSLTHTPSGMKAGHYGSKAAAVAAAKHFHTVAGDAGKDATFGSGKLADADMARMTEAFRSQPKVRKSEGPSYRIGSVNYIQAPAYAAPEGGDVARPGMLHADRAKPPVIDDGRDPIIPELARLNGQLVDPRHGILALVRRNGG